VLKTGNGEIVVIHRPKENADYQDYVPCRYCFGYFVKQSIWKHNCQFAPKTSEGVIVPRIKKGSVELMSNSSGESSKTGFSGLINGMRKDLEGQVAVKDALILQLGQKMCMKFGGDRQQFNYIRSKMRQVARLLCCLRRTSGQGSASMSNFIEPTQFSAVVEAARQCAGLSEDGKYQAPTSVLKSGNVIRKLAEIKQGSALERSDPATAELCTQFVKLCDLNWASEVSAVARRNLTDSKRTGVMVMPLTEDVVKLNQYLVAAANRLAIDADRTSDSFLSLTQVTLAKVILFNRKRQGEVSKLTVEDYSNKMKADAEHEMTQSLSDFERGLLKVLERVEIRGKRGRTVPVLFSAEMERWIDVLLAHRSKYIPAANPFLFANVTEFSYFRGSDVLRTFAMLCGATKPHTLTSTKLRKHIASTVQVVSLQENELDSLAKFLGHDLRVHSEFYRLPSDVIEIARISKIFLAAEKGKLGEYAGKKLSDITVAPNEEVETSCDESDDVEEAGSLQQMMADSKSASDDEVEVGGANAIQITENSSTVSEDQVGVTDSVTVITGRKSRKYGNRKKWTESEMEKVAMYFASDIMNRRLPGKAAIEVFLSESGIERKWTNVKDFIRNRFLFQ